MKFNVDSPVFQFIETLTDFIILNLVFMISCIPIITTGAALTALYDTTAKEARGEHGYMTREYWRSFKKNLKSGTGIFLLYAIVGAVLLFNYVFWLHLNTPFSNGILIFLALGGVLYLVSLMYVFGLNARFENTIRQTVKNSLLIALVHPKQTLFLLLIFVTAAALGYVTGLFRIFLIIFGFAFLAYCQSFLLLQVFAFYED